MHKSTAAVRCPWIIASRSRCYFAETNSSDKICRRLIVYSCFMAHCNLNTFMISLKAHWRQRSLPSEAAERKGRFILTSGFISSVRFIISLYARWLRGRPSLRHDKQQCLPTLPLSSPHAHIFISHIFEWLNYSDLCKWVVFIFLPWKWKLKVTQRDPHLLLKLNCSECAVWIIPSLQGFVNRWAVTPARTQHLYQFGRISVLWPTLCAFMKPYLNILHRTKAIMFRPRCRVRGRRSAGQ